MKRTTIFKILTLLYIVVVAVICFARFSSLPTVPGKFLWFDADKVVHFLMFVPFPVLAFYSFPLDRKRLFPTLGAIILIFAIGAALAGLTEFIQGRLPYRTMDINDYKADVLGLLFSSLVVFLVRVFSHKSANA
ncbi:MAG: VanZ family protein [Bacteroidales bacterium]|nr:VanZ family protein [Bacteroidales bacterium]